MHFVFIFNNNLIGIEVTYYVGVNPQKVNDYMYIPTSDSADIHDLNLR